MKPVFLRVRRKRGLPHFIISTFHEPGREIISVFLYDAPSTLKHAGEKLISISVRCPTCEDLVALLVVSGDSLDDLIELLDGPGGAVQLIFGA